MKTLILFLLSLATMDAATITGLIQAIEQVESNGNVHAHNKAENALGCLQIRPIMVADYNRITGEQLSHSAVFSREVSYNIATEVFLHYMKGIEYPTAKHLAFIWNGGGSAWKRVDYPLQDIKQKRLEAYWSKVKQHL